MTGVPRPEDDDELDVNRWVLLRPGWTPSPEIRWYIHGSTHTHRGHFHVCAPEHDLHLTVNLGDVAEVSPVARIWLDGFLSGQEADLWEFMGDEELYDNAAAEDVDRWVAWNARFRKRGFAPRLRRLPPADDRYDELGYPTPWCFVGGLYRVWAERRWQAADPQPDAEEAAGRYWPGSICADRDRCSWAATWEDLSYCEDCHQIQD